MPAITVPQFTAALEKAGLTDEFLKLTGLSSMNELSPANFDDAYSKADPSMKALSAPESAPAKPAERPKSDADAQVVQSTSSASDFLYGFKHMTVMYSTRRKVATWQPVAWMMMFITHELNALLVEHFYFKRSAPNYHPLLLRLYTGILFYVQTLRASHAANSLDNEDHYQFLDRFIDAFPPENLPVPAPLLHIFKSICASQPEIPQLGYVTPTIPDDLFVKKYSDGPKGSLAAFSMPNITGILSMIEALKAFKGNPKEFKTILKSKDYSFHGINYAMDPASWTTAMHRALTSPGLEYPLEGVKSFHESFINDRLDDLELPALTATLKLDSIQSHLHLKKLSWFKDIVEIADAACRFIPGSGTLADCSPLGPAVGQIQVNLTNITALESNPETFPQDNGFYIDSKMQLSTSCRSIDQLSMIMSSAAHVNVRIKTSVFDFKSRGTQEFWSLTPIEKSQIDESALFSVKKSIKKMLLDKSK